VLKTEGCATLKIFANRLCAIEVTDYSEIGSEEKGFEKMKCMKITSTSTLSNFDYMNTFYIVLDDEDFSQELVQCFADEKYEDDDANDRGVELKHVSKKCARMLDVLVDHGIAIVLSSSDDDED
jgi:hypothetical protein